MKIIDPAEVTEIPMQMDVDGEVATVNSVHVSLETGRGYDIRFPAVYKDGVVTCSIHGIDGVVQVGDRKIRLEAVINEKYYVPLEDTVRVASPLKVSASLSASPTDVKESVVKPVVKASMTVPAKVPSTSPVVVESTSAVAKAIQKPMRVMKSISVR
jgi:hypothetical protein